MYVPPLYTTRVDVTGFPPTNSPGPEPRGPRPNALCIRCSWWLLPCDGRGFTVSFEGERHRSLTRCIPIATAAGVDPG
jgi:hypothetical protein